MNDKRILVIAGSDSSGGAGLEADQKVIATHGCYAMTATTALTVQDTRGVYDILHTPPEFVKKQIDACIEDIGVDVVKTGMLASAETVEVVAESLESHGCPFTVIDPVMISTSGTQLLPEDAVYMFRTKILPLATVLTPNIPEAKRLLENAGHRTLDLYSIEELIAIAKALKKLGPKWVLLKGGHFPLTSERIAPKKSDDQCIIVDILAGDEVTLIETTFQKSKNTHGTGCSLASAIASNVALGLDVPDAVQKACRYVNAGIELAIDRGKGSGPINHFHSSYMLPFCPGGFLEYLLSQAGQVWRAHVQHEFVQRLADGTLPLENFQYYLIQDYLFLVQFARAKAVGASKAKSLDDSVAGAETILHIKREMSLHLDYCKEFGLSKKDVESTRASQACIAYTRFVLDVGNSEDWFALQVALAPCLVGYGVIAKRLYDDPKTLRGKENRYWKWIENYVADDYVAAVSAGKDDLEKYAVLQGLHRISELTEIFIDATRMETGFWDMGHKGDNK